MPTANALSLRNGLYGVIADPALSVYADGSEGDCGRAGADGRFAFAVSWTMPRRCGPGDRRGCIRGQSCGGAAEDDRGKSERQQGAAEGGRHERRENSAGRKHLMAQPWACS